MKYVQFAICIGKYCWDLSIWSKVINENMEISWKFMLNCSLGISIGEVLHHFGLPNRDLSAYIFCDFHYKRILNFGFKTSVTLLIMILHISRWPSTAEMWKLLTCNTYFFVSLTNLYKRDFDFSLKPLSPSDQWFVHIVSSLKHIIMKCPAPTLKGACSFPFFGL